MRLDGADSLGWPTSCKLDCSYAVPWAELKERRGTLSADRRRQIVRTVISTHGWNVL